MKTQLPTSTCDPTYEFQVGSRSNPESIIGIRPEPGVGVGFILEMSESGCDPKFVVNVVCRGRIRFGSQISNCVPMSNLALEVRFQIMIRVWIGSHIESLVLSWIQKLVSGLGLEFEVGSHVGYQSSNPN